MNDYDKNKKSSYIQYWDVNNLYGWEMLQKLPVINFEWIKDTSQFNEDFIKSYNEEFYEGYFLEVYVHSRKKYMNFIMICHFYLKKIEKVEKLVLIYMIKLNMLYTSEI